MPQNWSLDGTITASSYANREDDPKYGAASANDDNLSSHWASRDNYKLPQWIQVDFAKPRPVDTVVIVPVRLRRIYDPWREIELSFSDGSALKRELPDKDKPHVIRFPEREVTWCRVTISSTYQTTNYVGCEEFMTFQDPQHRVTPQRLGAGPLTLEELTIQGRREHPCVYENREDVARARERIERDPWARDLWASIRRQADEWLQREDAWILAQMPQPGACFAYGFTGCPICGASWGTWGGARCSWDRPGKVTCANGHLLPDEEHPDPGTGYVAPDGRIHYMVGSYNAWVVEQFLSRALPPLSVAYALTGEDKYAAKAAVILDGLARIYPSCDKGSWDYPSNPPSGRFNRPWYQVARTLVRYVDQYDLIFHSPALDQPSVVPGLTRRENIEKNLLLNGAMYCYQHAFGGKLHNGHADYLRGSLAVGCVLGIPEFIENAVNGPYSIVNMIENNLDRDGRYYETSLGYALHARNLYLDFAEMLVNYRDKAFPQGVNLFRHPKLRAALVLPDTSVACAGQRPAYGDSGPTTRRVFPLAVPSSRTDYRYAQELAAYLPPEEAGPYALLARYMETGGRRASNLGTWALWHARTLPEQAERLPQDLERRVSGSAFFGQKGLALVRSGTGREAQALLLRFGPSLNHGHLDDLNVNYFAQGYEATYDLGYGLGSTHTQVGWAHLTASHNVVVVNEQNQRPLGGSLHLFVRRPGVQVIEASSDRCYADQGVDLYRRTLALMGAETGERYVWDVFRVHGGSQHDYSFHSQGADFAAEGVDFMRQERGSLAGPDLQWGLLQGNDGDMKGYPNKPYWRPPPGNGYGFLCEVQRGPAGGPWSATWRLPGEDDPGVRLTVLAEPGSEAILARAPGIYPRLPKAGYAISRRKGENLNSVFSTVWETYSRDLGPGEQSALELLPTAKTSAGELKPIPELGLVLYKGTQAGDTVSFELTTPADGKYAVSAQFYNSPSYGTVQVRLDDTKLGKPYRATAGQVKAGPEVALGEIELTKGKHRLVLEVVAPDGAAGHFWIGLSRVALRDASAIVSPQARPFLTKIERLDGQAATPPGGTAARVLWRSGREDILYSGPPSGERRTFRLSREAGGPVETDAQFAAVTKDGEGVRSLMMAGGSVVEAWGLRLMGQPEWRAKVATVDYDGSAVTLDAVLPEGTTVAGWMANFSRPEYSRETSYRVLGADTQDGKTTMRLNGSLLLGKGQVGRVRKTSVTSIVPHEYVRGLGGETDFFRGKLMTNAARTVGVRLQKVTAGKGLTLEADFEHNVLGGGKRAQFAPGDELDYWDLQQGDECVIVWSYKLERRSPGKYVLYHDGPTWLGGPRAWERKAGERWVPCDQDQTGYRVPATNAGMTELRLGAS